MFKSLKIKYKNSGLQIKYRLKSEESVNKREFDVLNSKRIKGIMKPSVDYKSLVFNCPDGISLRQFFFREITCEDCFFILAQIIEIVKSINKNMFDLNNLVMDVDYVFINSQTKELQFVYKPIVSYKSLSNLSAFVYEVASSARIMPQDKPLIVSGFVTYLQTINEFSIEDIEKRIMKYCPSAYELIKDNDYAKSISLNENMTVDDIYYNSQEKINNKLREDKSNEYDSFDDEATSLLIDDEEEGTTVLDENDEIETALLVEDVQERFPYLVRINNYENIEVNKPSFRIGKEKSYVDYFVSNNNAVSRIHADIISKKGCFFIKDNNSTNGTYVNGVAIESNVEIQIFDGDEIILANEKFEFNY